MTHEEIKKALLEHLSEDQLIDALIGGIVNTDREYVLHGEGIAEDVVKIELEVTMGKNTSDVAWVQFPGQRERFTIFNFIHELWYCPSWENYKKVFVKKRGKYL